MRSADDEELWDVALEDAVVLLEDAEDDALLDDEHPEIIGVAITAAQARTVMTRSLREGMRLHAARAVPPACRIDQSVDMRGARVVSPFRMLLRVFVRP